MIRTNRSFQNITDDLIQGLAKSSNITGLHKASKARSFLETVGAQFAEQYNILQGELKQGRLSEATKQALNEWGDLFNVDRLNKTKAYSTLSDFNVRFFVPNGTFGDLDSIPVINYNTKVFTESGLIYNVVALPGTISPSANTYYAGVKASQAGSKYNISKGAIKRHNLNMSGLYVTNDFPISNGTDDESDDQYRFRVINAIKSLATGNNTALYLAARFVPGVGDISIAPSYFGIGTTAIFVLPLKGPYAPTSVLDAVRTSVEKQYPASGNVYVTTPDIIGVEMDIVINYNGTYSNNEKTKIKNNIRKSINEYFRNININDNVNIDLLKRLIQQSDNGIKSIGSNNSGLIDRIYLYYSDNPSNKEERRKEEVLVDKTLSILPVNEYELFSLEFTINNPINLIDGLEG